MPRRKRIVTFFVALVFIVGAGFLSSCSDDGSGDTVIDPPPVLSATCEGCHLDAEMLQATVDPGTEPPGESDPGEG